MPRSYAPSPEFVHQVRNALAHLYDYAYLENHPLATLVDRERTLDQVSRAQKLRRLLLDCIESLRPGQAEKAPPDAVRAHAILFYRYVDGITMEEIAARRDLSERQAYRELEKGLDAVARVLEERVGTERVAQHLANVPRHATDNDRIQVAHAEVSRLRETMRAESLDLLDVLRGVASLLEPVSERASVEIVISAPDACPPILGDRVLLRQAFLNLLTQALHATEPGRLDIAISIVRTSLNIAITGRRDRPGQVISSSAKSQLSDVSQTVAQVLIEAQGGRLETDESERAWNARVALPTAGRLVVLVVDDNEDLITLFERYLAGHDVHVVGATGGEEALRLAATLQPQLITLDVMIPNLDGWEILERLKNSPETGHIPVVICSVLQERELAEALRADDYITKPVRQADVMDVVERWLGRPRPAA